MEELDGPVSVGALYARDNYATSLRVSEIFIDEDGNVQISIEEEIPTVDEALDTYTVDGDSFIEQVGGKITRLNHEHDAREWRQ